MRFRLSTVLLYLTLIVESLYASSFTRTKFNPDQWVRTRTDAFVLAARAAYENDKARPAYERVLRSIARTIKHRRLDENEAFASRYREFIDYFGLVSLDLHPDHELGFNVPDRQYFAETRSYVDIPVFLTSQSFLRYASRAETLYKAKSLLRQINSRRELSDQLLFFSYRSRHLGTPDNDDSRLRLLVLVPGDAQEGIPEKWVQFGVTDAGAKTRTRNLSVVSAKLGAGGIFDVYFKDYFRSYRRNGAINIKGRWELGYGDDNCVRCHKSGVLPIFPEEGSVSPAEEQVIAEVNQRLRAYGSPRFDRYFDLSKLGPGLGSADFQQRAKQFGEDFRKTPVAGGMKCGLCHNRNGLGALNWPMESVIVGSYIKGGQMPFGSTLDDNERTALAEKLIQEYFDIDEANPGILKSWLLGKLR